MNLNYENTTYTLKGKSRSLSHNTELNLYKRRRTFDGIRCLDKWSVINDYMNLDDKLNCLEIGSHEGQSTTFFIHHILKHSESKLLCCDPWFVSHWNRGKEDISISYEDIFDLNMKNNDSNNQVSKFRGLNTDFFSTSAFKLETYDIVYVDDIHTYDSTKSNINNIFPRLKKNGIIIFDDYDKNYYDLRTYKEGISKTPSYWCDPVKKAVDECISQNDFTIIYQEYQIIIMKSSDVFNPIY